MGCMKLDLKQYKAFILDLDGTLIDSEKYHAEAFAYAIRTLSGYEISETERREFFESHTNTFVPILSKRHGLTVDAADVLQCKRDHVNAHFRVEVFPQAIHFIRKWKGRTRLALASNSPKSFVRNALVEGRMIDLFEAVHTADDVVNRKPDPEIYVLTLKSLGLTPAEVLAFEDSPAGVIAAKAAGCPVVMIENGSHRMVEGMEKCTWRDLA